MIIIRDLGLQQYNLVEQAMLYYTKKRNSNSLDEIWLVQHPKIFTQGYAGKNIHLLNTGNIPVIQSLRGGQVTYHGPGQQIMYILLDLKRLKIKVSTLISFLEQAVINTLLNFSIHSYNNYEYPGVYVKKKKICSIGLSIKNNFTFHGLSLNVSMDLSPFSRINPCGQVGLRMTQISNFFPEVNISDVTNILINKFLYLLNISNFNFKKWDYKNYVN